MVIGLHSCVYSTTVGVYVFGSLIDLLRPFDEWISRFDCSPDTVDENIYRGQRKTCPVKRFGGTVGFFCFVTATGSITPNQVMAKCITAACWHYSGRSISTPVASCSVSRPYILGKVAFNKI